MPLLWLIVTCASNKRKCEGLYFPFFNKREHNLSWRVTDFPNDFFFLHKKWMCIQEIQVILWNVLELFIRRWRNDLNDIFFNRPIFFFFFFKCTRAKTNVWFDQSSSILWHSKEGLMNSTSKFATSQAHLQS